MAHSATPNSSGCPQISPKGKGSTAPESRHANSANSPDSSNMAKVV
jgi:hypothetical protein